MKASRNVLKNIKLLKSHGVTSAAYRIDGHYSALRDALRGEGLEMSDQELHRAFLSWDLFEKLRGEKLREYIERLYLDYFNNFLSVERFASYYGLNEFKAARLIKIGRKLNHRKVKAAQFGQV